MTTKFWALIKTDSDFGATFGSVKSITLYADKPTAEQYKRLYGGILSLAEVYEVPLNSAVRQEQLFADMKELIEDFHHRWDKDDDLAAPELGQRLRDVYWRMRQ